MKGCVLYDGEQSGSSNINTGVTQGCVIAPTLFSIFLAAFISLAAVDQAKGVDNYIYRTDWELFNMRRLKAKTKVKATPIVDLQYADDCAIAAYTEADLQNTLDAFSEAYKLLGLTVNVTKTKVIFQPAQPLTATAPNIDIEGTTLEKSTTLPTWVATSRSRQTSMSKFNIWSDVRAFHTAGWKTESSQKEASEQQPRYWSTRLLFSQPSYMAVRHGSPTVAMLKCSNSSNSAYSEL